MNTLHTLNASARENTELFARLLRSASPGDSLLLIEDGVYNLADATARQQIATAGLALYCLQPDVLARGMGNQAAHARPVDDSGFVELSCTHSKVLSWFR